MNLFLTLKEKVGCCYISDMAFGMQYNQTARSIVAGLRLEDCEDGHLVSVYSFLSGMAPESQKKSDLILALRDLG